MGEGISQEKSHGGRTIFVFGLLAALILIAYVIYSGVGISKENAVKGALLTLQKAQVDFHRLDHDGDGYLEYAMRLHGLGPSKDGKWAGLITPALAAACDEDATEDLYGYRFRAAKCVVKAGKFIAYSVDSDGNGTLDGFGIIALPLKPTPEQNVVYYIAETGKPWAVDMTKETTPPPLTDYLPERR